MEQIRICNAAIHIASHLILASRRDGAFLRILAKPPRKKKDFYIEIRHKFIYL